MMKLTEKALIALAMAMMCSHVASSQTLPLFPTGVDESGEVLPGGAADPHYFVLETRTDARVLESLPGSYVPNDDGSAWIWENADGSPTSVTRTFRLEFDLTGFDASTASIAGTWATDNYGLDILINGVGTDNVSLGFSVLTPFSIEDGFVPGINTLDFVVQDVGFISGFRVGAIEGSARPVSGGDVQEQSFAFPLSPGGAVVVFDQFDDLDGKRMLEAVTLELDASIDALVTAENDSALPAPEFGLNLIGFLSVDLLPDPLVGLADETFSSGGVAASDGVPGSGPDFFDFGLVSTDVVVAAAITTNLEPFVGTGTIDAAVLGSAGFSISGATDSTMVIDDFGTQGIVRLTYEFSASSPCAADIDGSGDVGFGDLLAVLADWGPCGTTCPADLDENGVVEFTDLLAVLAAWGPC